MSGKCYICEETYTKTGMSRHLQSCIEKNYSGKIKTEDSKKLYYHLVVEDKFSKCYWLHLQVDADSTLAMLDAFLREIWLECCGHLSAFTINGKIYSKKPMSDFDEQNMDHSLKELLTPEISFSYEYDFGSSTNLKLRVVDIFKSKKRARSVNVLARNEKPAISCSNCGELATRVCPECLWQNKGWLCDDCADKHDNSDCFVDKDMLLAVVNSPRTGICAYSG